MAIEKIRPRVVDETGNYTFNNVTATGNLIASNANLGNIAVANYIKTDNLLYSNGSPWSFGTSTSVSGSNTQVQFNNSGSFGSSANFVFDSSTNRLTVDNITANGAALTNLTGANITGTVGNANYAAYAGNITIAAQSNITSVGTLSSLDVTGNITTGNANLGNFVIANFFSGSGNNLSNIQGSNVTGAVSYATTANSVAGANVSGAVTYAATANAVAGANVLGEVSYATTANSVAGANVTGAVSFATTANSVAGANVSGAVGLATFATTANAVAGANVSGQVANALVAGTVYTNAQPNITSVGTLANLSVSGNANIVGNLNITGYSNLGNVGNIYIAGGSSGYVLQTDGSGNLSWTTPPSSTITAGDVYVNNFTGDGTTTAYTLTVTPTNVKYVTINIDGVFQLRQSYTVSGTTLTFGSAPLADSLIEVSITVPGVVTATVANTVSSSNQPNITSVGTLSGLSITGQVTGNLIPSANITYNLGNATNRWNDIYLSNSTIYLGDTAVSANSILPINLTIAPEVLTINVAAPAAGDDTQWLWNWQTSTLPYARTTIVNSAQLSVPLYKQGTYQINNFANEQTGVMTQRHEAHLKWIDGAGLDNLVSWAVDVGNVAMSNVNINGNVITVVQRINVSVPSTVTPPTLTQPSGISYNVSFVSAGAYTIGGAAEGNNKNIGPLYRGSTYTFNLASSIASHPFYLTTDNGTGFVSGSYIGEYTNGVTGSRNNGTTGKTTLVFTVPSNAPDILYYQCGVHSSMRGAIVIKDLAVETNINGNYVLYFQHTHEGHKTPIEIRPIPSLVDQMCVVYDATAGKFVPQDLATYVENTPSFKNKIREVAGTATLIAPNGVAVVPTVLVVEDASYLPLINNKEGDIAFDSYYDTIYVWQGNAWRNSKATTISSLPGANITGQVGNALIASTVYTSAQPNITSVGTLTGFTSNGIVSFTNASNVSLGAIGNVKITGGSANNVLKTDGTGNLSWSSAGVQNYVQNYYWRGGLTENVGSLRYYIHTNSTLVGIYAYLVSAGFTQSTVAVKKNGSVINTITIPASTTNVSQSNLSISLLAGDYLTVDITQSSSASDLYINFVYAG